MLPASNFKSSYQKSIGICNFSYVFSSVLFCGVLRSSGVARFFSTLDESHSGHPRKMLWTVNSQKKFTEFIFFLNNFTFLDYVK